MPTTAIALIREHAVRVKPPRALFVPFPYGYALGRPNDPEFQHRVLGAALGLLNTPTTPVLAEFDEDIDTPVTLTQASTVDGRETTRPAIDPAAELITMRGYYERWVSEHDDRSAVGLTGIPPRRWRGLIRFLEAFADGRDVAYRELPEGMSLGWFVRYASDDLKAYAFEARMCQRPGHHQNDLHVWFWSETAIGALLERVSRRLAASDDPEWQRLSLGVAR